MALEVETTQGTWVAYTAGSTSLPETKVLRFRDTAFAVTGASPNGVGSTATISLPWCARFMICGATEENGTNMTAGALTLVWIPRSATFTNALSELTPAGATAAGIDASVVMTGAGFASANTFGIFTVVPMAFQVWASGLTYTGSLTLLSVHIEVHKY